MVGAPVEGVDVKALLARDALEEEAYPGTCCGSGRTTLERALWVELDGQAPAELVLEMFHYVGEGASELRYHVYDVSDPGNPRAIGKPVVTGGYIYHGYGHVEDFDGDGRDELMVVQEVATEDRLAVYALVGGELTRLDATHIAGDVFVPFDHDADGVRELVAISSKPHFDEPSEVTLTVLDAITGEPHPAPRATEAWLPDFVAHVLMREERHHSELTMRMLEVVVTTWGVTPSRLDAVNESIIDRIEDESDYRAYEAVGVVQWPSSEATDARLEALMERDDVAALAATMWLRTHTPEQPRRAVATDWLIDRMRRAVTTSSDEHTYAFRTMLGLLDARERELVCDEFVALAQRPHSRDDELGSLAWEILPGPMHCARQVSWVLANAANVSTQVVRGALHAYSQNRYGDPIPAYDPHRDAIDASLRALLHDRRPLIRAEAARALPPTPENHDVLRRALINETDGEVQRSIRVSLPDS